MIWPKNDTLTFIVNNNAVVIRPTYNMVYFFQQPMGASNETNLYKQQRNKRERVKEYGTVDGHDKQANEQEPPRVSD